MIEQRIVSKRKEKAVDWNYKVGIFILEIRGGGGGQSAIFKILCLILKKFFPPKLIVSATY